jgi:hypothetical protein
MNYFYQGVVKKHPSIQDKYLALNPLCKYPVGCMMKLPRMVELGYIISENLMAQLLGKCLPLGITTVEDFKKSCPSISQTASVAWNTGLPTAQQLFDKSDLGQTLL